MSDDLEREILERSRYLKRTSDLNERESGALAWREVGYSSSGIAKRIDSSKSTVGSYLDRIAAQYGFSAVHTKPESKRGDTVLEEPTREEIHDLEDEIANSWCDVARDHPEVAPEWFTECEEVNCCD